MKTAQERYESVLAFCRDLYADEGEAVVAFRTRDQLARIATEIARDFAQYPADPFWSRAIVEAIGAYDIASQATAGRASNPESY